MKSFLLAALSLGLSMTPALAAPEAEVIYLGRAGLYDQGGGLEFTRGDSYQSTIVEALTHSGWLTGFSERFKGGSTLLGTAAWVARADNGASTRIGLFSGAEFTRSDNFQVSASAGLTESGWLRGHSDRYDGGAPLGVAAWAAKASDGSTLRIGFFSGSEFTAGNGFQVSVAERLIESGWVSGYSERFNSGFTGLGRAAWVARASDGSTTRIGLFSGPEFTRDDNFQDTATSGLTESGWLTGYSLRYNGSADLGGVAWVARASDGQTLRVGLYAGPEFTSTDGRQFSSAWGATETGWVIGNSQRYSGGFDYRGDAVWVARASDGVTTRIGLFSSEYTRSDNLQSSSPAGFTASGWVTGVSLRYNGGDILGSAAWVARASDGATTRIGIFSGSEFTRNDGYQISVPAQVTESGWLRGHSERYNGGSTELGYGAWVARASDGATTRIGLFTGSEFTGSSGQQMSFPSTVTESGWLRGYSFRYNGGSTDMGNAAWVARASDGATTRLGFFSGAEFTRNDGYKVSFADHVTESGWLRGISQRFNGGATYLGQATWVAGAVSGATTRVGLSDAAHTALDGTQISFLPGLTEEGFAWGHSFRYHGDNVQDGQTAWIYDLNSDTQITLELSVRASDGAAFSVVNGITEFGLAYGTYALFSGETDLGPRAFLWSTDLGVQTLDEAISGGIAQYGWEDFLSANVANASGIVVGYGNPLGNDPGSNAAYLVQAVPEPATAAFLLFGSAFLIGRRRRLS